MGWWIIPILILANAGFVLVEMALVSSRRARLEGSAAKGDRSARAALRLLEHPTAYLSTVQIGITLMGLLSGAFGERAIARDLAGWLGRVPGLGPYAHGLALLATVVGLTFVTIVFGELVPKRLAQSAPETFARLGARPMWLMSRVCLPLVWLLTVCTNLVLKLVPSGGRESTDVEVEDEVKAMLATGTETGLFHESEQRIVERVFKLSDQGVKGVMVPRTDIEFLLMDDTAERIRAVLATSTHSHFPVCRTGLDDLVGIVHVKDLVRQLLLWDEMRIADIVHPPVFVPESTAAIGMLGVLKGAGTRVAFVLDEYGVLEGLVTLHDVVEALVGEVRRQGEVDDPSVVRRADGSYLLDGMLGVGDLKEVMGVASLPKEREAGYETLGGFVMTYLGRIPASGDTFTWDRFKFEVVDMDKARVDKVLMTAGPERKMTGENQEGE